MTQCFYSYTGTIQPKVHISGWNIRCHKPSSWTFAKPRQRREQYEKRVAALSAFISSSDCREVFLANYFASPVDKDCGVCDNCVNKHFKALEAGEFAAIEKQIYHLLSRQPVNVNMLLKDLKPVPEKEAWEVINFLISEEKLQQTADGMLSACKRSWTLTHHFSR